MAWMAHLAMGTTNVEKTANFYKEVFGLQETVRTHGRGLLNDDPQDPLLRQIYLTDGHMNLTIVLVMYEGNEPVAFPAVGLAHFGFVADNLDETQARLEAAGGRPLMGHKQREGHYTQLKYKGPEGVVMDVCLPGGGWGVQEGQTAAGVTGKIQHLALGSTDVVKSTSFYKAALGLDEVLRDYDPGAGDDPPDEMLRQVDLSDGYTNLAISKARVGGMYHFGFAVDDLDETLDRLKAAGAPLIGSARRGNVEEALGSIVKCRGPEGVIIDLSQRGWRL